MDGYASYPSLADRGVLVTGGGSGIGASLVSHFAAQGARVGFIDIAARPSRALVTELEGAHRHSLSISSATSPIPRRWRPRSTPRSGRSAASRCW